LSPCTGRPRWAPAGPEQALASLLLLRQIRRQAAERRYLRGRPGPAGTTGEQRVQATRESRAADRTLTMWARDNAADLRRIAAHITTLTDLPTAAHRPLGQLNDALAHNDPAALLLPLNATRPHLTATHPDLAARLDTLTTPSPTDH
jgi:hypothetical protein